MYSKIAVVLSVLAASVSGAAIEARGPQVKFALANDQSGAYASVAVAADGVGRKIDVLFDGTSVDAGNAVKASSAQLAAFPQGVVCTLKNKGAVVGTLDTQRTFLDLDGNPAVATPVNLNGYVLSCRV